MKNEIIRAIAPFLALTILLVLPDAAGASDRLAGIDLELNVASRVDQFDWNIAGNIDGNNPSILSELTWENLEIAEVNSKGRVTLTNNHFPFGVGLRANVNYGEILDGDNQDSDYQFDDRTGEWSRSNNKAKEGSVWDLTVGAGPVFRTRNHKLEISPLVGYSYHAQHLTIHEGFQTISQNNPFSTDPADNPPPVGPIAGLNSTYDSEWTSGWAGVDLAYQAQPRVGLHATLELHSAEYKARADWNLRTDLNHPKSFDHDSNEAAGFVTSFGTSFGAGPGLLNLEVKYQKWRAENGVNKTYFSDGTIGVTRVNEVNWESFSVAAGFTVRF